MKADTLVTSKRGLALVLAAAAVFTALRRLPLRAEVFYPWKQVYLGALDGPAWPGLVMALGKDAGFAFRLEVERNGETAESEDFFYLVSEVGPQSPDGQYARVRFDLGLPFKKAAETPILVKPPDDRQTLTLEWSRRDESIVVGRIRCPEGVRLSVVHYFPWDYRGAYDRLADGQVRGRAGAAGPVYVFWTDRETAAAPPAGPDTLARSIDIGGLREVHFAAAAGDAETTVLNRLYRYKNGAAIDQFLMEEERNYGKKRVRADGLYEGAPEALTDNMAWMVLYQPGHHRLYTPAGRRWIFKRPDGSPDHWQIFEWDSFFNALELSVESSRLASDAVRAVLETQYPNGNIPNWRSRFGGTPDRSQPPVGAYVVLKLVQKTGDLDLLRFAYPILEKWHAFWTARGENGKPRRDGNANGLLEWGSDPKLVAKETPPWEKDATPRQRAAWESGQDDLPNWDEAGWSDDGGTLSMDCLDLNCLYALDASCMSQMAMLLDRPADAERYQAEYERVRALVDERLWNEKEGFYYDRHWDGRFSKHKAASNFFPLIARIPDERKARRMLQHLLDPRQFWGDYVIPSISRDDPAFQARDQQYWRGTIWPPTNYLVYQGLKAYGFDVVASEFASKSAELFLRSWKSFRLCPENFDSLTGEAGGQRYQSWGPLFVLTAVEEYVDFTPWEGFRFGMIDPPGKGWLYRAAIQGRHYDVKVSPGETLLVEEGEEIVSADGGAVFRHFLYNEREVSFEVKTMGRRKIRVGLLKKGKYQLLVDGREADVFEGRSVKVTVPEGDHAVVVQLLEDLS